MTRSCCVGLVFARQSWPVGIGRSRRSVILWYLQAQEVCINKSISCVLLYIFCYYLEDSRQLICSFIFFCSFLLHLPTGNEGAAYLRYSYDATRLLCSNPFIAVYDQFPINNKLNEPLKDFLATNLQTSIRLLFCLEGRLISRPSKKRPVCNLAVAWRPKPTNCRVSSVGTWGTPKWRFIFSFQQKTSALWLRAVTTESFNCGLRTKNPKH